MRTLSIVHLTTFLQGGAGRAIADLACAQHLAAHRVVVVASATSEGGYGNYPDHIEQLRTAGVPVILEDSLFKRDRALNLRVLDRLRQAFPDRSCDIVHAHAGTPARIGLLHAAQAGRRTAVLQTQHGWGSSKTAEQARQDLATLREVDRVVVTSDATRALLAERGIPDVHMRTIPCGLAERADTRMPAEAAAVIAPLRAKGCRVVGCIGSVNRNKNQRSLIEALARIGDRSVAAVFIGEGAEQLEAIADALGVGEQTVVLGYRPDAARWMPAFDALVMPSLTEGQGLAVLEAFRAGTCVVASDIPAVREMVADGETGWLFDPRRPEGLAAVLMRVWQTPDRERVKVIETARRRFVEHYALDAMIVRYADLYRELLDDLSAPNRRVALVPRAV